MKPTPTNDKIDMAYLKSDQIGKVLAKGLAEVYKIQPKFPVDFLARWLLNYSQSQSNHDNLDQQIQMKEQLRQKQQNNILQQKQIQKYQENIEAQLQQEEQNFKQLIMNHNFHQKLLCEDFCEFLVKRHGGMTGVYVGYVDHPSRPISDNEDDDYAHLDTQQPKVINYIGACKSHEQFMIGKTLQLESGVTGDVFKDAPVQDEQQENSDTAERPKLISVYIPSVVNEARMVYFQWPKLGAYFAIPIVYNSCLFDQALDQGIEERIRYRRALEEQRKEKELKELEFQERIRIAQEQGDDYESIQEEYNQFKNEWVELQEPDFLVQKREFVLCIDTLGKDCQIGTDTRQYFIDYALLFVSKWEEKEKQLLSKDIDQLIIYQEQVNVKERSDLLTLQEDQSIENNINKFDDIRDKEKEYNFELQSIRLQTLTSQLTDPYNHAEFLQLKEMRVLKYPGILQALLIFLGHEKHLINKNNTNLLDWEKVKSFVNETLFEKIANYTHRGPKIEQVKPNAKLQRIHRRLEKYDLETVEAYNVCYGKLLKWLQLAIHLRRTDIEIRRSKIEQKRLQREQKIYEVEKMKEDKNKALEEHKANLSSEDLEQFNQEDWELNYDHNNILPEIPPELEDDIDEDYDE